MSAELLGHPITLLGVFVFAASANAQSSSPSDPSDPNAGVPASTYESVLPRADASPASRLDGPHLPWRALYRSNGEFVPESEFTGNASDALTPEDTASAEEIAHGGSNDARGVIEKVYSNDGKVKIKHGPIAKLDMPGMTMIFYLKDPQLIDGLREGDEVGFDVELDGTTFYITRFER